MIEILPGVGCGMIGLGMAALLATFLLSRFRPLSPFDHSETNLRTWASAAGLTLPYVWRGDRSRGCVMFRILVEDRVGRFRAGWATVPADRLDPRSELIRVTWERAAPAIRAPRHLADDPLWDEGLDGGPGA